MAKKKDPYGRIQSRFVNQRLEDRGFDEMDLAQKEQFSNRFTVLAKTVEGRGKIAAQILGEDATPEKTKALRQRLRSNLPKEKPSIDEPTSDLFVSPASRVRPVGRLYTPAASMSTQSTVNVPAKKQSNRSPLDRVYDAQSSVGNAISKVTGPIENLIMPFGAADRAANKARLEKEGPKFRVPTLGESGRLLGDAFSLAGIAPAVTKIGARGVGGVASRLGAIGNKLTGGKPAQQILTQSIPSIGPVTKPTPPARPSTTTGTATRRTSTVTPSSAVTPTPSVTPTQTVVGKILTQTKPSKTPKAPKAPKAPKPDTDLAKIEAEFGPVKFGEPEPAAPGSNPPTPMQATVTPAIVTPTAPVATPAPKFVSAPKDLSRAERSAMNKANYAKVQADAKAQRAAEKAANPKPVKEKKAKKDQAATEFFDQPKGTPAGEVVGGSNPKVNLDLPATNFPPTQKSLPKGTESKKLPTSTPDLPAVGKPPASRKPSGRSESDVELLKRFPDEVIEYKEYPDPNMRGGVAKKTVLKSQATTRREQELKKSARTEMFGGNQTSAPKEKPIMEFFEKDIDTKGTKGLFPNEAGQKIQDEMLVFKGGQKPADTYANQRQIQNLASEEATRQQLFEIEPRRRRPSELRKAADVGPRRSDETALQYSIRQNKAAKDLEKQLQSEEQRRRPSRRRTVKTRRVTSAQTNKGQLKAIKEESPSYFRDQPNAKSQQAGTPEARQLAEAMLDPRTPQQIKIDLDKKFADALKPPSGPRQKKVDEDYLEAQQLTLESQARLRKPEIVAASKAQEKANQLANETLIGRSQRVSGRGAAKERNKIRKELATKLRRGPAVEDGSVGLRQTVADYQLDKKPTPDTLDSIFQGPEQRAGQYQYETPPVIPYGPNMPPPLPGASRITYSEKFQPAQLTYEDLLKIQQKGDYEFRATKSPFTRITSTGEFVLKPGRAGIQPSSLPSRSTGITKEQLREMLRGIDKSSAPYRKAKNK